MTATEELHLLVENIPVPDREAARAMLRGLFDPFELTLMLAKEDDEPESAEEGASVDAALADPGPNIPFELLRLRS
jgi:hypothetical protein